MPYRVQILPRVRRQLSRWPMPDDLIAECYLRLNDLQFFPATQLARLERPFDGMDLVLDLVDPTDRLVVHRFAFQVVYAMDEEHLFVTAGVHERYTIGE